MRRRFYRAAALLGLALAAGCDSGQDPGPAVPSGESLFPPLKGIAPYQPPPEGGMTARFVQQLLDSSSQESLRFAKAQLAAAGSEALPLLLPALEAEIGRPNRFPHLVNISNVLAVIGDPAAGPALIRVVAESAVPVARSAALDALRDCKAVAQAGQLAQLCRGMKANPGVLKAAYRALGQLHVAEAGDYLEEEFTAWLAGPPESQNQVVELWKSITSLRDPDALTRLQRLQPKIPAGPLDVECLRARSVLGDNSIVDELRAYTDAQRWPAKGIRQNAVMALAELGEWDAVLVCADDPHPDVQISMIQVLATEQGRAANAGLEALQELAQHANFTIASTAAQELAIRGHREVLDPWLRLAREYPLGTGAVNAIALLKQKELADERSVAVLWSRWTHCDTEQKFTLLRAMAFMGHPSALPHFQTVLASDEVEDVRVMAAHLLPNLGAPGLPLLLEAWARRPSGLLAETMLYGLAEYASKHPQAKEALLTVVADESAPDEYRRFAFTLMPKSLGVEAFEPLMAARDAAEREGVRAFLDRLLTQYF